MTTMLTVLLMLIFMGVVILLALMFSPKKKNEVSVRVDENSVVHVEREDNDITLKVEYTSYRDRPADEILFPDIVNEPVVEEDESKCGGMFWQKVANLKLLEPKERERILLILLDYGFIYDPNRLGRASLEQDDKSETSSPQEPVSDDILGMSDEFEQGAGAESADDVSGFEDNEEDAFAAGFPVF